MICHPSWTSRLNPAAALLAVAAVVPATPAAAQTPATREFLRTRIGLTDAQLATLASGEVVTRQLASAEKGEMVAFGAVRLRTSAEAFLAEAGRADTYRSPSVISLGLFQASPGLADLEALRLEAGDFDAARSCRPGDCDLKLARSAIERLQREVDWRSAQAPAAASALMRRMLLDFLEAYRAGGTDQMATYADKERSQDTRAAFRQLLAASPYLAEHVPAFHRYVEEFPRGRLEGAHDHFYWASDKFGPKPTLTLNHVTAWRSPDRPLAVRAVKQIYASHFFQAGLDLTVLAAEPDGSACLLDLYRARIDPPTGMLSGVILGKIRSGVEQGVAERLRAARSRLASAPVR